HGRLATPNEPGGRGWTRHLSTTRNIRSRTCGHARAALRPLRQVVSEWDDCGGFGGIRAPKQEIDDARSGLALPYRPELVEASLATNPAGPLSLEAERGWIDAAWSGDLKKPEQSSLRVANKAIEGMPFALNLFDRAA